MAGKKDSEIIIIGAGAAGLLAADALSRAGKKCLILEANNRIGGRIFTVLEKNRFPVELGAEFIHGRPRVTWDLLKRFRMKAVPVSNVRWRQNGDGFRQDSSSWERLSQTLFQLKSAKKDRSFAEAMAEMKIPPSAKKMAENFVRSYHAADIRKISVNDLVFQQKTSGDEGMRGYRIVEGYGALLGNLAAALPSRSIRLNQTVWEIRWSREGAEILTQKSRFKAARVLVTVPLGVLKYPGALVFRPALRAKEAALKKLEMGFAARISLFFSAPFWQNGGRGNPYGFFQAEGAAIPIWWTGLFKDSPVLTGWMGGPETQELNDFNLFIRCGLESLSGLFGLDQKLLKLKLRRAYFHDWNSDPFSRGAYTYCGVGGMPAREEFARPVERTIFFAGEATDNSGEASTVAGAFLSGLRVAKEIIASAI
jgi:monoamine oxidase